MIGKIDIRIYTLFHYVWIKVIGSIYVISKNVLLANVCWFLTILKSISYFGLIPSFLHISIDVGHFCDQDRMNSISNIRSTALVTDALS